MKHSRILSLTLAAHISFASLLVPATMVFIVQPASAVEAAIDKPVSNKWVSATAKPSFGIQTKDVQSTDLKGILVEKLELNQVPSEAGLNVGDVILAINGVAVANRIELDAQLAKLAIGDSVQVKVERADAELDLKIPVLSVENEEITKAVVSDVKKVSLTAGTPIKLVLEETVSSNKSRKGAEINYSVKEDVKSPEGILLVKQGAKAGGLVTTAKGAGGFGRKGKLEFTAEWVESIDGQKVSLRTTQEASGKSNQAVAVASFLFLSILGGFIKGKNATVEKGTVIPAFVDTNASIVPLITP